MEAKSGNDTAALVRQVEAEPRKFDFFQAVRLLETLRGAREGSAPIGFDADPVNETVALRTRAGLGFPSRELSGFEREPKADETPLFGPPEAMTTFMGLVGPLGTLPQFYNELVLQRSYFKDASLRDFLDLFHHRTLSLFYRAWRKYRLAPSFEHSRHFSNRPDPCTDLLLSLVGLGTPGLAEADTVDARSWIHFGAHFAQGRRSQGDLEGIVSATLGAPARVEQFVGQWIPLSEQVRCRLPTRDGAGANHCLGSDLVLGERVWDVQSKVLVQVGPTSLETFLALQKGGSATVGISNLVGSFLNGIADFELVVRLDPDEVPPLQLGDSAQPARLGRTTWLPTSDAARLDAEVRIST